MAIGPLASSIGIFILYLFGSILSWRQISLVCAAFPIIILVSVFFVCSNFFELFKILFKLLWKHIIVFRFLSHQFGNSPKSVRMMQRNHFNGFVAGFYQSQFAMNSSNFNIMLKFQMRVLHVQSNQLNVIIRSQGFVLKSRNLNESDHSNHSFLSFVCNFSSSSPVSWFGHLTSYKCFGHMAFHCRRMWPPLSWAVSVSQHIFAFCWALKLLANE